MCEDLFILAQNPLSTRKCSLRYALALLLCSTRMITSPDDRRRGGAALHASGSVAR